MKILRKHTIDTFHQKRKRVPDYYDIKKPGWDFNVGVRYLNLQKENHNWPFHS